MTDEMMVQAQKPSVMPYVLGGAGVGALGGLASAKYANFGVQTPKYSSWEEAINDSNDEFVKKHYDKLISRLGVTEDDFRDAIDEIKRLSPKPGNLYSDGAMDASPYIIPDFRIDYHDG